MTHFAPIGVRPRSALLDRISQLNRKTAWTYGATYVGHSFRSGQRRLPVHTQVGSVLSTSSAVAFEGSGKCHQQRPRPSAHHRYPTVGASVIVSGGIHAKRGFNYQDTVILYLLITHFAEHGPSSTVRPEGVDDLELTWSEGSGPSQTRFVQVKKPREDRATNPTGAPLDTRRDHKPPDS